MMQKKQLHKSSPFAWCDWLGISCIALLFLISPLAHTVALKNTCLGFLSLALLGSCLKNGVPSLPARYALVIFIAWVSLSLCWSFDWHESLGRLWADIWSPMLVMLGCFIWGRFAKIWTLWCTAICASLCMMLILFLPYVYDMPSPYIHWWRLEPDEGWIRGRPHFLYGIGEYASFSLYALPIAYSAFQLGVRTLRYLSVLIICLICALQFYIMSRATMMLTGLGITLCVAFHLYTSLCKPNTAHHVFARKIYMIPLVLVCCIAVGLSLLNLVSRVRFSQTDASITSMRTLDDIAQQDVRPLMWRVYVEGVKARPVLGVGFGRSLVGRVYASSIPESLYQKDHNTRSHAHNYLLNLALTCGLVGVVLFFLWWLRLCWYLFKNMIEKNIACQRIAFAALVLLVMMVLRNLTDDFVLYNVAMCSYAWLGMLLARVSLKHAAD